MNARGGRRETTAKVLKDRRSPRQRGRTGTSVRRTRLLPPNEIREPTRLTREPVFELLGDRGLDRRDLVVRVCGVRVGRRVLRRERRLEGAAEADADRAVVALRRERVARGGDDGRRLLLRRRRRRRRRAARGSRGSRGSRVSRRPRASHRRRRRRRRRSRPRSRRGCDVAARPASLSRPATASAAVGARSAASTRRTSSPSSSSSSSSSSRRRRPGRRRRRRPSRCSGRC